MRKVALWGIVLGLAAVGGVTYALARGPKTPAAIQHPAAPITAIQTWRAGARPAPAFRLKDQHGATLSLAALRGRRVIVTFIDPACRQLCPLEAKILMKAARGLPAATRPTIVAVSVNPWADSAANFEQDRTHWRLGDEWRWAVGDEKELAPIWQRYGIAVQVAKKVVAGVTVRTIAHTEASFIVDRSGHERALFLYPFSASNVTQSLRGL